MASSITSGIRVSLSFGVAIILGLFMLAWDGEFIQRFGMPLWLGPIVFVPLLAVVLVFGADCLIQQLSCGEVKWLVQLQRVAVVPIPFFIQYFALYMLPILRWPIEGLVQSASPLVRKGLSSGFYTFWTTLYVQSLLISLSQLC